MCRSGCPIWRVGDELGGIFGSGGRSVGPAWMEEIEIETGASVASIDFHI